MVAILFWSYFFFLVPIFKQNASDVSFLGRIFFFHNFLTYLLSDDEIFIDFQFAKSFYHGFLSNLSIFFCSH